MTVEARELKTKIQTFISGLGDHDYRYPHLRQSSVLVPLFVKNDEVYVLLTKRSKNLRTHAGDIAFPGGVKDHDDKNDVETALREAEEEIGLNRMDIDIVGVLPPIYASPKTTVVPVIGIINPFFIPTLNKNEVDFAFSVPLDIFLRPTSKRHVNFHSRQINLYYFQTNIQDKMEIIYGITSYICMAVSAIVGGKARMPAIFVGGTETIGIESAFVEYYHYIANHLRKLSKL